MSRRSYRFALAICIAAISFLAFAPLTAAELPSNDKVNHVVAFLVLAWLAEGAYPGRGLAVPRWGLLAFYGLLIEVIQYHLPYRYFSLLDLAADVTGILAYVVLAYLVHFVRPTMPLPITHRKRKISRQDAKTPREE